MQKFVEMWDTFCIHFVYINSDLQKGYIIQIMYTFCIQESYRMFIKVTTCKMDPAFQHM